MPRKSRNAIASEHTGNISARSCPTVVSSSVAAMYAAPMTAASSTVTQTRKRGPVLSSLAAKYDGSFQHTCENDTYTVTLSLRAG